MYDVKILKISEDNLNMSLELEDRLESERMDNQVEREVHEPMPIEYIMSEHEPLPRLVDLDHNAISTTAHAIKEVANPTQAAVLPHYVSIDFQGCQLNVNFYDSVSKPISPHEVIQPEIDHIELPSPVHNEPNGTCTDHDNCPSVPLAPQEVQDSELSPLPPKQGGDIPSPPDPIWFA